MARQSACSPVVFAWLPRESPSQGPLQRSLHPAGTHACTAEPTLASALESRSLGASLRGPVVLAEGGIADKYCAG